VRIGIDARPLSSERSGIGRYLYNLLKVLEKIDHENDYFLYSNKNFELPFENPKWHKRLGLRSFSKVGMLYILLNSPWQIHEDKIDLFWGTENILPFGLTCKKVLTVHDFVWYFYPKTMTLYNFLVNKLFAKRSILMADHLIAISESTSNDLVKLFNVPNSKVSVIHNGIDPIFFVNNSSNVASNLPRYFAISRKYILAVGTLEPRKNIEFLAKSFKEYLIRTNADCELVIVGGSGWSNSSLLKTIKKLGLTEKEIRFLGYVSDDDLQKLYLGAEAFVFPSIYEGFGFPPLEAMASGCPVIASNSSSIPEVCGDAALYIDPYNIESLVDAFQKLLQDKKLKDSLVIKGKERVKSFVWKKAAIETLEVLVKNG